MDKKIVLEEIEKIVGSPEKVSSSIEDIIVYMRDVYTPLLRYDIVTPDFVILPETVEEVQEIVKLANKYNLKIYPRSMGANIAGSAIPYKGGIVLDLKRMDKIIEINPDTMTATVEPGVNWGALRREARKKRLDAMPIAGPYETSPTGNFLLANITIYSSKYPMDRAVTLEAVLPNGEIIRTGSQCLPWSEEINPYFRYAYGPDITGLFRGSLGNYGVITKLVIRLRPLAEVEENVHYGFEDLEAALHAMRQIERMEFSRYSMIINKEYFMRINLGPQRIFDSQEREKIARCAPPFLLSVGLGGQQKQIDVYKEIVEDEAVKNSGRLTVFEKEIEVVINECVEGGSQKTLRMFCPYGTFATVICCVPLKFALSVRKELEQIVSAYGLKDVITGEPLEPELIIIPFDRGSTVYVDNEILYQPFDAEIEKQVQSCLRDCYSVTTKKYGSVHTIPNRSLLKIMSPPYANLLTNIKKIIDPNNIMLSGGPYSFEL